MNDRHTGGGGRRRIVMIGTAYEGRGGVASLINVYLTHGLFKRWPLTFIQSHVMGSYADKLRAYAVGMCRFMRMLLAGEVALLHLHVSSGPSFWRKASFALLAFLFRVPVIAHSHSGAFIEFYHERCGPMRRRIVRFVLERSARVIALSNGWREKLRVIAPQARFVCVPNPVYGSSGTPRQLHGRTILFMGKLCRDKGVFDLLEALRLLRARLPGVNLVLAGHGDMDDVRAHAAALHLLDVVVLPGWVSGTLKDEYMRQGTVLALPSYVECMPMILLEAMSAGLPCVATRVGGIPDILTDGVEGCLVAPGDVPALAAALEQLLIDKELYARMSGASLARFRTEFAVDVVMPRLEHLYSELGLTPSQELSAAVQRS
jgi:glycosyltransferase involved in cell wall biosynthesis